jgi:predicted permease
MLLKRPAVTIVGGLSMAIGVGMGAAYLEVVNDFLHPSLPLHEGDRIVGVQEWDLAANKPELRNLHDFVLWRGQLRSVRELGAFRSIERNLGGGAEPAEPAVGAEMTPSGFTVARVPALLGRTLVASDEQAGSPPVIVLGYHVWKNRFAGDRGIVGRTVRLGSQATTVVGVMPEGFGFPVSQQFWVPLRPAAVPYAPREGPAVQVFGRLAPGASLEEAKTEMEVLGRRAAADQPATHERLRPRVMPYTELFVGGEGSAQAYLVGLFFVLLLLVLSSNVATMVFARTASRENEIAMRFALGASRGQILAQFFVESLVLALAATVVGLAAVAWGTKWVTRLLWEVTQGQTPFWLDSRLNWSTILYALVLAVLGALVAGVIPALKATGSKLQARLRHPAAGGDTSLRFGGMWSAVIAVQVAFAILILPPAIVAISSLADGDTTDPGFAAEQYLSARLEMDLDQPTADSAASARAFGEFQASVEELRRRLQADPRVSKVTFASRLPGMDHPQPWAEVDSAADAPFVPGRWVMSSSVEPGYFDAFGAKIVAGRGFSAADRASDPGVVVVNEYFVTEMLGGRNAVGRRVRYSTHYSEQEATGHPTGLTAAEMREPGPWYEIVGVVSNLGMDTGKEPFFPGYGPGIYHPLAPDALGAGGAYSERIAFHVQGDAEAFAPRLREIAQTVHPSLRLYDVLSLDGPVDKANRSQRVMTRVFGSLTAFVAWIALLIAAAGTYSVMSFTVARQTREIGIRIALGADRRRIITGVFSRAMLQIGIGLVVGAAVWFYVSVYQWGGASDVGLLLGTAVVLMGVGMVACGVPVRRALRIEPMEALRDVG